MSHFVELDGAQGEGGGQILRSALALSLITGKPFKITNIRANRPKPGLAAQHLACVRAAATIGSATYKGGTVGSTVVTFEPAKVRAGEYKFTIGTAGATGLVLHTVAYPLVVCGDGPSQVTITGGTHVSDSPCYHYNAMTWCAYLERMGIDISLEMIRPGFYPRGGGEIRATLEPCAQIRGLNLGKRAELTTATGLNIVADLPEDIGRRQGRRLATQLKHAGLECHVVEERLSNGPSTVAGVVFRQPPVPTLFFALGERGKRAEHVAEEACDLALAYRSKPAPVDPHAADQIVLPLALSESPSEFLTTEVTEHLRTNIAVIQHFLDREITIEEHDDGTGTVRIGPGVN